MINTLFGWITNALYAEFGSDYSLYVEDMEQNTQPPCFVVSALEPLVEARGKLRYERNIPIAIHYFTDRDSTSGAKRDAYSVAERLWNCLEYLPGTYQNKDVLLRGEEISWTIAEGVLQFFVTYRFYVDRVVNYNYMEDGTYNGAAMHVEDYI